MNIMNVIVMDHHKNCGCLAILRTKSLYL